MTGSTSGSSRMLEWKTNEALAVGKGATVQQFVATVGDDRLEIDVAPWGEGHLKVNGQEKWRISTMSMIDVRLFAQ